jgi:RHS repeat-associated protein
MYLLPEVNLQLRPRLLALAPGTRIVSHDWDLGDWAPDRTLTVDVPDKAIGREKLSRVHLWLVPAPVHGLWCSGEASLHITQRFQAFSATLQVRGADAPAVVFGAATAPRQVQVGTRYAAACEGDVCTHTLTLPAGQTATVDVALRNTGLVAWEAGAVALVAQAGGGTPARQEATAEQGEVVTLPVTVTAGSGDGEVTWRLEGPAASAVCDGAETRGAFGPTVVVRVQVPVAPVDVDGGPRVLAYYHHDAIGSVRAVTDADGDVVRRYEYEPFGQVWDGPAQAPERRLFTGQEHDAATGLDYFGARYLRADLGRFTTIDPVTTIEENLVDPQRWNRYAYVRNNPLRYVDPDGRMPVSAMVKALEEAAKRVARQAAVREAWRMERDLVIKTGAGTAEWTAKQIAELKTTGKVSGFVGYHINSVAANDLKMAREPGNIRFIKGPEHLAEHGGDWRTPTSGSLIDRALGGAAVIAFVSTYDAKMNEFSAGSALVSPAGSWRSYVNPVNWFVENAALLHAVVAAANAKQ